MKHHRLAYLGFLAAACSANDLPESDTHAIVGGTAVTSGYDNVVMIDGGDFICSGTLIGVRTVLTAAHCAIDRQANPTSMNVVFGNSSGSATRIVNVVEARIDRRFQGTSFAFDAALLELAEDVTNITPVVLNGDDLVPPRLMTGDLIRGVGFGFTASGSGDTGTKRQALMPVVGIGVDILTFGDMTANICQGDSGGPQLASIAGVTKQISISSFTTSDRCGSTGGGVRVDSILDFVQLFLDAWEGPCRIDGVCSTGASCPNGHVDPDCDACGPEGTCGADCPLVDYDCPPGLDDGKLCTTRTQCESRRCYQSPDDPAVKYCASPCDRNGVCPAGQSCIPMEGGLTGCVYDPPTPYSQGQPCVANDDCYSNVCERKVCMTPCDPDNDQCPVGSACTEAQQVDFACFPGGGGGGCAVAAGGTSGSGLLVFLALVGLSAARRRRGRPTAPPGRR